MATTAQLAGTRYRNTARGRKRGGKSKRKRLQPLALDRDRFRLTARRPRGPLKLPGANLDITATEITWRRHGSTRTGELTLSVPGLKRGIPGLLVKGDIVRLEVSARDGAPWRTLWEMVVMSAVPSLASGQVDVNLKSQLAVAQQSRKHWRFRKDRHHPHGWTATEIAIAACARFHVPKGEIAQTSHRITKLIDKAGSVVEVVTKAFAEVRKWTGHLFDVSISRGVLDVRELRRPAYMLEIGPQIIDAVLDDGLPAGFATAIIVTSTVKTKGHTKRRKLRVKVVDRARVRRYGYIVRHVNVHGIDSVARLRKHARALLARHPSPVKSATITLPGIPYADRGDALDATIPELGMTGVIYTTGVEHHLTYASYEMDLTVAIDDPWKADERRARVARKKAAAARRRRRRLRAERAKRRKPKKAARRA